MKLVRAFLAIALLMAVFGSFQPAKAQVFSYTSAYQVYNLEGGNASITIVFYNQDGTTKATINDTIGGNASRTYFVVNQLTGSFNGSVVIGSTTQIASIANVHANNNFANGSFVAQSTGAKTINIPLLMKNNGGYSTWFNVQNAGTGDATVNVAYSDGTNAPQATIKYGASKTYSQTSESHSLPFFAGVVTSDQDIVVTVIEESTGVLFAYNGFRPSNSTPNPVMPLVHANNGGYDSGIAIKNDGTQTTNVTVTYTPTPGSNNGSQCTETQSIPNGQMKVFALNAFQTGVNSTCTPRARFVGSAKVTTNSNTQPLSIIVNQHRRPINGGAYGAFNPDEATSKVIFPLIMDRNVGWWTGFNIQNVGNSNTSVTCTFTGTTFRVGPTTLTPGQALNALQDNKIANRYVGSATCTASGGTENKIVGVVNESQVGGGSDQLMTYEGINVP